MLKKEMKVLITGGGSGGHLTVAKAVIDSLIDDYNIPLANIIYVGGDLGMEGEKKGNSLEQRILKDAKFQKYFIRAGKLQRKISLKTLFLPFRTLLGLFDSLSIIRKSNPSLIFSSGGFVSVPVCIAGWLYQKPIFLHEQTASVGLSNRIISKLSKKIYISFKNSEKYFPKEKVKHSGNIIKKSIFNSKVTPDTDKDILALTVTNKQLPFLYFSGGGLGSHVINVKVLNSLNPLLKKYRVLLQTGDNEINKDYEKAIDYRDNLPAEFKERFVVTKYIDSNTIGYVLNSMDLFVGRAGANTVYEIGVLKKYALFIPISWVTHNEQYLNAKVLSDIGTANILEEKYLNDCNLLEEIERFQKQLAVRKIDNEKLEKLFPTNALSMILDEILNYQK